MLVVSTLPSAAADLEEALLPFLHFKGKGEDSGLVPEKQTDQRSANIYPLR